MPLIEKDKELLYEISSKKYNDVIRKEYLNEREQESYYLTSDIEQKDYLQNYEFQNIEELKEILEKLFKEKKLPMEFITPVMVMILKLKGNVNTNEILMETIYNF